MLNFKRIASSTTLGLTFALFAASASHAAPADTGLATLNLNTAKSSQQTPLINVVPKDLGAGGTPRRVCKPVMVENCSRPLYGTRAECEKRNQDRLAGEGNCPEV
jgi:hypothetical protein